MSNTSTPSKAVVVVGDVTMDWNIGRLPSSQSTDYSWNNEDLVRTSLQRGGAVLLAELIEKVSERLGQEEKHQIHKVTMPGKDVGISPNDEEYHHSYANWGLYKYEEKSPSAYQDVFAWRVKNFVGLKQTRPEQQRRLWSTALSRIPEAEIIVLDDAALAFRDQPPEYWRDKLKIKSSGVWLVIKMARPVAQGKLWEYLRDNHTNHLIAIVTANDLRLSEARISRELSWERTAQDLTLVLKDNPHLRELSRCAHVIVSFETAGIFLLTRQDKRAGGNDKSEESQATLFFDPETIEGMWAQNYSGGMIGYTSSLVASVVHQLMVNPASPDIPAGIKAGLASMRKLLKEGYGKHYKDEDYPDLKLDADLIADVITRRTEENSPFVQSVLKSLQRESSEQHQGPDGTIASFNFNSNSILKALRNAAGKNEQFLHYAHITKSDKEYAFGSVQVKPPTRLASAPEGESDPKQKEEFWTILDDKLSGGANGQQRSREELAKKIVREGVKDALKHIPQGKFDKLVTVDRREMESYRSIGTLIREYKGRVHQDRPLSIAVFGPPGAGKSFGISAVAKTVMPEQNRKLTFNLSQFNDPGELFGALHQVRDEALTGSIPLVFWDEFDVSLQGKKLGWLRYFLAPMQDGKFQEGQITHPVGRAIFIFAGGTCENMNNFDKSKSEDRDEKERFESVKGPDFVSRLKGYIDILGPNPKNKKAENEKADDDPNYIIRRAILLRILLEQAAPQLFQLPEAKGELRIDTGVLWALLKISKYKHGARSMESVINMSLLTGKSRFERSSLPSEEQLNIHVDGRKFYDLTEESL